MSVELIPNDESATCDLNLANGTWGTLVNTTELKALIGEQRTHDPVVVDADTAKQCAAALRSWTPPKDWFCRDKEQEGLQMIITFLENCQGFKVQ